MKAYIVGFIAVFFSTGLLAQNRVHIFDKKSDSLMFAPFEGNISKAFETHDYKTADSLIQARSNFLATHDHKIRLVFRQDGSYTPYQSLPEITNKDSITQISIIGKGKRKLPDSLYMYKNLSALELIDFKLSKIPRRLLAHKSFKKLTICNNYPRKNLRLPRNSSITSLTIRGDEDGMLPKSYRKFKKLEVLQLSRNNLREVPKPAGCRNLKRLDLNYNSITRIPSWIDGFEDIVTINLNNNKVSAVDWGIEKLSHLEELSLYNNNLSEFPSMLYSMKSLRVIDLYYNHIPKITADIGNLKNLEILYLANNELYTVPDEIGELTNLRELYLHHNKLSNLPASIGNLTALSIFRINNNNMIEWPVGLKNLKSLGNFDCSSNQFDILPIADLDFKNLKILSLGGNPWNEKLKPDILAWVDSLRSKDVVVHLDDAMLK
jgi:leucine-rich repeat protein SHOC2